jgi:hypothetical protein
MLVNAAYCGYVCGLRSKDRSVRGLHEPLVEEELFDRVQEIRAWRTRVLQPGKPSEDYLLRKLLYCERFGARMHGTRGSRAGVRRYLCSTRRYSKGCGQPITPAEPLEAQLVEWLHDFQPDEQVRTHVLDVIRAEAKRLGGDDPTRRRELHGQLDRLRDLYVLGDAWAASRKGWGAYLRDWVENERLHSDTGLLQLLDERLDRQYFARGPYFFPDLAISEEEERAAIDAGQIRATRVDYVGRLRGTRVH